MKGEFGMRHDNEINGILSVNNDAVFSAFLMELLSASETKKDKENEYKKLEEGALSMYSQLQAFMHAGFTREEAMEIILTILGGIAQ